MALNIKSAETDRLARELAAATGESVTEAVTIALRERLANQRRGLKSAEEALLRAKLREVRAVFKRATVLDSRSPDEIIGYNDDGTFD